ncbi:MAG: immunoglobulin domain-containing protein [Proteobacteria bacterium]|nr:immunoglobulin domain-containing protein [Pseudomonadota bacterium]
MCSVTEGDAPYTITWTDSSGGVVYTGNEMTGAFYTFMVTSIDYGTYTCAVMNNFGTSSSTIEVIQAGKNKTV